MPGLQASKYIWHNGELIPWDDAKVHIGAHVLHYGSAVFEGIRCYKTDAGSAVFRLDDHSRRLLDSARIYRMDTGYTQDEVTEACLETVRANEMEACYIRPLVFRGYHSLGVNPAPCPVETYILVWEWGKYLGAEAIEEGVDVKVSSWQRLAPNSMPGLAKAGANYMNSQLIKMEAIADGYVEGIALDSRGFVSEGSGENIFAVRKGTLFTPPFTASILSGITRMSVIRIARDLGYEVREMDIPREALYTVDEVFFTGTAAEITPIRSIDKVPVGDGRRGPVTAELQEKFFGIVEGGNDPYGWLTPVYEGVEPAAVEAPAETTA